MVAGPVEHAAERVVPIKKIKRKQEKKKENIYYERRVEYTKFHTRRRVTQAKH